jgi:hypothetical protein
MAPRILNVFTKSSRLQRGERKRKDSEMNFRKHSASLISSIFVCYVKVKAKMSLCLTKHHAMKTHWGVEVYLHAFLTSALHGGEWSASRAGRFTPREKAPGTHWIGGWVGPRAVLDAVMKRKIPNPRRKSNPRTPIVLPVAQRYTDCNFFCRSQMFGLRHAFRLLAVISRFCPALWRQDVNIFCV